MKYETIWDFSRNEIVVSSDTVRALDYGYDVAVVDSVIAESIKKFVIYNNEYGYSLLSTLENVKVGKVRKILRHEILDTYMCLNIVAKNGDLVAPATRFYDLKRDSQYLDYLVDELISRI